MRCFLSCVISWWFGGFFLTAQNGPDLVIEDVWAQGGQVLCQLANIGDAAAPPTHQTVLVVDGTEIGWGSIQTPLDPGESATINLTMSWQCSQTSDQMTVVADADDAIAESDETNNELVETWSCDQVPPVITAGPTLSQLAANQVTVKWTTDEASSSGVAYDFRAGMFQNTQVTAGFTKSHSVTLTGLTPFTTYQFYVRSNDPSANFVESEVHTFTTPQTGDTADPVVEDFLMTDGPLPPLDFRADVSDDTGVDHVAFFIDGAKFQTDYSHPFEAIFDPIREGFEEAALYQTHTFGAVAVDRVNKIDDMTNSLSLPKPCPINHFAFETPIDGQRLFIDEATVPPGTSPVQVAIYAQGFECSESSDIFGRPRRADRSVDRIELYVDDVLQWAVDDKTELLYDWDPVGKSIGDYAFKAKIINGTDCIPTVSTHTLTILERTAYVHIASRTVTRTDSHFTVTLTIENQGTAPLQVTSITDSLFGFQVVPKHWSWIDVSGEYDPDANTCAVRIETEQGIAAGDSHTFSYDIVPVMRPQGTHHFVGQNPIHVRYQFSGTTHAQQATIVKEGPHFDDDVADAFAASNYLIVTSPKALLERHNDAESQRLLETLAEFAIVRQAVLGYYHGHRTLRTGMDANDGVGAGHVFGEEWEQEIFVSNDEDDTVGYHRTANEGDFDAPGLSEFDGFAVGNVDSMALINHHPQDEVLVVDGHDQIGEVTCYMYEPVTKRFLDYPISSDWEPGDPFLTGDIRQRPGYPEDELIFVKSDGTVHYFYHQLTEEMVFASVYEPGDFVLTANVFGSSMEELVIGDKSENDLVFYDQDGTLLGTYDFDPNHPLSDLAGLAAGDVTDDAQDEFVGLDAVDDIVFVMDYSSFGSTGYFYKCSSDMELPTVPSDVLIVADVLDSTKEEILVGRKEQHDGDPLGHFDIFTYPFPGTTADRHTLDAMLNPLGAWADKMAPDWVNSGYLLIVGESDIVPAFANSWELSGEICYIESTDGFYGNTADGIKEPEISVGRIISNNAKKMREHIERTMDVLDGDPNFDKSDALVMAGRNKGAGGEAAFINMTLERWSIRDILGDMGFFVAELEDPDDPEFFTAAMNKDVIHLAGHGNWEHCDVITCDDVKASFDPGETAPLIYANSCLTGKYTMGASLAEVFLEHGAVAYIGATEISYAPYSKYLAEGYHRRYDVGVNAGLSLKEAKRHCAGDTAFARYNSAIFHLFGDPMLEPQGADKGADFVSAPSYKGPLAALQVIIPDYEVLSHETDEVSIPGGGHLVVPGEPIVPTYSVSIDYPFSHQVQDVILTSKTDVSYPLNLNIEVADPVEMSSGKSIARDAGSSPDWWPENDFDWDVRLLADGTTTLVIEIHPFSHNAITNESEFYQEFNFDIVETTTSLAVQFFDTTRPRYDAGEPIMANLHIENYGPVMDFLVEMTLDSEDTTQSMGFPLVLLHEVEGYATYSASLDPTGLDAGSYELTATIKDMTGDVQGAWTTHVALGKPFGVIRNLEITPECFVAGDNIQISCAFENTGDQVLSGRLMVDIIDLEHDETISFTRDFVDLAPGAQTSLVENWEATTRYSRMAMSGTATFDGMASPIAEYRFPADITQIHPDLPSWPVQNTVLDLLTNLFCDL